MPGATAESAVGNTIILLVALLMILYPFYRVISWLLEGAIDTLEAAVYMLLLLGFVGGIISTWGTPLSVILLVLLGGMCVGLQLLQRAADRRAMNAMDADDLAECDTLIARQPSLAWAYKRAVDICRRRGEHERAIGYVEKSLQRSGPDKEMERLLERLKRRVRQERLGVKICPECGTENPAGSDRCLQCERVLALPADILAGCATETGLRALAATAITLMVAAVALAATGGGSYTTGAVFVAAFVISVAYLYLRT